MNHEHQKPPGDMVAEVERIGAWTGNKLVIRAGEWLRAERSHFHSGDRPMNAKRMVLVLREWADGIEGLIQTSEQRLADMMAAEKKLDSAQAENEALKYAQPVWLEGKCHLCGYFGQVSPFGRLSNTLETTCCSVCIRKVVDLRGA